MENKQVTEKEKEELRKMLEARFGTDDAGTLKIIATLVTFVGKKLGEVELKVRELEERIEELEEEHVNQPNNKVFE